LEPFSPSLLDRCRWAPKACFNILIIHPSKSSDKRRRGRREDGDMEEEAHGVVIVGGGIAGLATALALHR
jgi:hypothetical protein